MYSQDRGHIDLANGGRRGMTMWPGEQLWGWLLPEATSLVELILI